MGCLLWIFLWIHFLMDIFYISLCVLLRVLWYSVLSGSTVFVSQYWNFAITGGLFIWNIMNCTLQRSICRCQLNYVNILHKHCIIYANVIRSSCENSKEFYWHMCIFLQWCTYIIKLIRIFTWTLYDIRFYGYIFLQNVVHKNFI